MAPGSFNGAFENCGSDRRALHNHNHKRQLSGETQDLLDQLDQREQLLNQIVHVSPTPRMPPRQSTRDLLERLDQHTLEVERLLDVGADVLTPCDKLGLEDVCLTDHEEFGASSSTTASSCGDLHSECSSPRSFRLVNDDENVQSCAVLGRFNLWLAADELKCLHKEIYAVRKQLSAVQIERLSKAVDVLTSAIETGKRT
eukprot:gnl/MRDRNA2_/MRDRNA2_90369_c0_seq1.p1 gnl/MRDRNA2_/MRDRNA2_90369_c0~~gnl/MRDRNA2_/MRDRNA2_90369_c0_seq1.p1  ORF type:complete len:200 (+),score=37.06 gnl/MRDRNA2_/MRDRNA2_90369_c0_seq1:89-688(+)